jgi:hypothetical protein
VTAETLPAILLGALLGLGHALDADHVAAVSAIVTRERSIPRAARVGALWGIGHSLTILLLGGAIIVFRLTLPERLVIGLEFLVALMLIGLGFANLRRGKQAAHEHAVTRARPFIVGTVHGLAGSAAVALLVLSTMRTALSAIAYLVTFGLGTIAGMVLATMLIAAPALYAGEKFSGARNGLRVAAGAVSIGVGVYLGFDLIEAFRATP